MVGERVVGSRVLIKIRWRSRRGIPHCFACPLVDIFNRYDFVGFIRDVRELGRANLTRSLIVGTPYPATRSRRRHIRRVGRMDPCGALRRSSLRYDTSFYARVLLVSRLIGRWGRTASWRGGLRGTRVPAKSRTGKGGTRDVHSSRTKVLTNSLVRSSAEIHTERHDPHGSPTPCDTESHLNSSSFIERHHKSSPLESRRAVFDVRTRSAAITRERYRTLRNQNFRQNRNKVAWLLIPPRAPRPRNPSIMILHVCRGEFQVTWPLVGT